LIVLSRYGRAVLLSTRDLCQHPPRR